MVRKLQIKDIDTVNKLGEQLDNNFTKLNDLTSMITDINHCLLVATVKDIAVGFIDASISFDEADINYIIIDEKYRRNGLAAELISNLIRINKLTKINIEVRESNTTALKFYHQQGFVKIRTIKNYYNNENAIFLIKEISQWKMFTY